VFSIGFTGIFFSSVYFLTEIWHYSLLWTGLAMIPPALMVVGLAPLAGRLAGRFGHRSLAVPGGVIFAAGQASLWYRITSTPSFVGVWLPSSLATGIGIAFVLPVLMSAFAQNLPAGKYAVGSGVGNAFRQFGSVIGAALAISYLSVPSRNLQPFDHLWAINILAGIGASLLALGLPRGSPPSVHDVTQAIRPGASRSSSTGPAAKDENESTSA
jgi:MFS family permease